MSTGDPLQRGHEALLNGEGVGLVSGGKHRRFVGVMVQSADHAAAAAHVSPTDCNVERDMLREHEHVAGKRAPTRSPCR